MGQKYSLSWNDVASSASDNTFQTIAAVIAADTAGDQFRVTKLVVGSSDGPPQDNIIAVRLSRIEDLSAGTVGVRTLVASADIEKKDSLSADCPVSGAHTYTTEPTAYATRPLYAMEFNDRTGLIQEWDPDDAPVFRRDQVAGLLIAPRQAVPVRTSGVIEFEIL